MDKIGIIGMGVVGKAIHRYYIRKISKIWIYDKYKNIGNLDNIVLNCRVIYIAVPTPHKKDIGYDLSELEGALGELHTKLRRARRMCVVFIKSTILPGTADKFAKRFPYLNIIYNPEFLSNKTAYEDFSNPKQIILGKTSISSTKIFQNMIIIHRCNWPNAIISGTTAVNAECVKLFLNNFYSVKIQFFNELWYLVKSLKINDCSDVNYKEIVELMVNNGWLNPMHTRVPGTDGLLSYGGKCFPKDTKALLDMMRMYSPYYGILEKTVTERDEVRNISHF